jgi:hypothetical protein
MKNSLYQIAIIKATNCKQSEVEEVEDIMRNTILHSTLDWLSKSQFNKVAKEAYELFCYMNSEEGKLYVKEIMAV